MLDVREITIAQAHDGLKRGDYTAKDLTAAFLDRIQKLDKAGPRVNSTMAISASAMGDAVELDAYFKKTGTFKGKLHGIPVLVKDQVPPSPCPHVF